MGKVIKILLSVLSYTLLISIALSLMLTLLLDIPLIQNHTVKALTRVVSNNLGTSVSIGRIHIAGFSRVRIDRFVVDDLTGEEMLSVDRIKARLDLVSLLTGKMEISQAGLDSVRLRIYQPTEGDSNIKEFVDRISGSKDGSGNFAMAIHDVAITNSEFILQREESRDRKGGIDFSDMQLRDLNLYARLVEIVGADVTIDLHAGSLEDKSGFRIDSLSLHPFRISHSTLDFNQSHIVAMGSDLNLTQVLLDGESWKCYQNFVDSVAMKIDIAPSRLTAKALSYFVPAVGERQLTIDTLAVDLQGTLNDFDGHINQLSTMHTSLTDVDMAVRNLVNPQKIDFRISLGKLLTTAADADCLVNLVDGITLPAALTEYLPRLGKIEFNGEFDGEYNNFTSRGQLTCDAGKIKLNLDTKPLNRKDMRFAGQVEANAIRAGELLDVASLGNLSFNATVNGELYANDIRFHTDAAIELLEFKGYRYRDIAMQGDFLNRKFTGNILSRDKNIDFDFNGMVDLNAALPDFAFDLQLSRADLSRLNLVTRDSTACLSGHFTADASGNSLDNLNGYITSKEITYITPSDTVRTGQITISGQNDAARKSLKLESSFAQAEFVSQLSYKTTFSYLKDVVFEYVPMLAPAGTEADAAERSRQFKREDVSRLSVSVKKGIDKILAIFIPRLDISEGTKASVIFNAPAKRFIITAESQFVEWDKFFIGGLNIDGNNRNDSLALNVKCSHVNAAGFKMPDFAAHAGAKHDVVWLRTSFDDIQALTKADIGVRAAFSRDAAKQPVVDVTLLPSTFSGNHQVWNMTMGGVHYGTGRLRVDHFNMTSDGQSLAINGTTSADPNEKLDIRLTDFRLDPFSQLLKNKGYTITGTANADATIIAALGKPQLWGEMSLTKMSVNGTEVVPLSLTAEMNSSVSLAIINLTRLNGNGQPLLSGRYNTDNKSYSATATMKGIPLKLLDPLLKGVLTDNQGLANINLTVKGGGKQMPNMNGSIRLESMQTRVDYTNVHYTLPEVSINIAGNRLSTEPTHIYDRYGHGGILDLSAALNSFANIDYSVGIKPDRMLVLDTDIAQNPQFYGNVFATGNVVISGGKRGVNMNINATTTTDSKFFMPLSSKADISKADFITWVDTEKVDTTSTLEKRQIQFEQRMSGNDKPKGEMNIDIALNITPELLFQLVIDPKANDMLRARGSGMLNLHINPRNNDFTIYGDYNIAEGNYRLNLQNIIANKLFTINPGSSIKWTGDPLDATLNIAAVYRLKASLGPLLKTNESRAVPVECEIKLTDRLSQPNVAFNIVVPNAETEKQNQVSNALSTQEMMATQFIWLLAFNSFYSDNSLTNATGTTGNIGEMAGSAIGLDFLTNQLSNWLSTEDYNITLRYRPKGDLNSDEVDIGFSTELINDRLLLEVEGNYDTGNNPSSMAAQSISNLSGDASITWMIDRAGNLRMKGFTRTIDRFDENQGYQENGIGIYYREDFNSFKDLSAILRKRFSSIGAKRRARRANEAELVKQKPNNQAEPSESSESQQKQQSTSD